MLGTTIYAERFITFSRTNMNSLVAAAEIDRSIFSGVNVTLFEENVAVTFYPVTEDYKTEKKGITEAYKKTKKILDKYDIPYRVRQF